MPYKPLREGEPYLKRGKSSGRARELRLAKVLTSSSYLIDAVLSIKGRTASTSISDNLFSQAINALRDLSEEENIPIAIIGGAATIYHGYSRSTKDLDIVVNKADFQRILKVCHEYGITAKKWNPFGFHELDYKGIPIEVIEEGSFGRPGESGAATPGPGGLGVNRGLGFVSLEGWVRLKLNAGRMKDDADIVEVLKNTKDREISKVKIYLQRLNPNLNKKFIQLEQISRREKEGLQ